MRRTLVAGATGCNSLAGPRWAPEEKFAGRKTDRVFASSAPLETDEKCKGVAFRGSAALFRSHFSTVK